MAWIESHQELGRHPKTRRAAKLLSTSRAAVIGHIHCLWWWALDFAQDGVLTKFDADEIADACLWDGEPEAFVSGLVGAGFLDAVDDQHGRELVVHDWGEYAGRLIERRTSDAERKRRSRGSVHAGADVPRMSGGRPADDTRTSDVPYPTVPNRTQPSVSEAADGEGEPQDIRCDSAPSGSGEPPLPPSPAADAGGDDMAPSAPDEKPPKLRTVFGEESDAMQLAREFARGLREVKPDVKLPRDGFQSWAREFDLMLRVDHRPREKIEAVMRYARQSSFWRSVILSARNFRDKYDRLDIQREEDTNGPVRGGGRRAETAPGGPGGRGLGTARSGGRGAGRANANAPAARPGTINGFEVGTPEYYADARRRREERAAASGY